MHSSPMAVLWYIILAMADSEARKKARRDAAGAIFDVMRAGEEAKLTALDASPWKWDKVRQAAVFEPDFGPLTRLVAIPVLQGAESNTGRLGKTIDTWAAYELRRGGFAVDAVWPRPCEPRVWPADFTRLLDRAYKDDRPVIRQAIERQGINSATVLGRHYFKQIDVLIAAWDRGAELMVSTKAQMSSFGNNLNNRFEEFVGDAHNLRGRFPLAALGLVYLVRSTIEREEKNYAKLVDMLRGLDEPSLYDATCLVVVDYQDAVSGVWPDPLDVTGGWPRTAPEPPEQSTHYQSMLERLPDAVRIRGDLVPNDLTAARALERLIRAVLDRSPVDQHEDVRGRLNKARPHGLGGI